MYHDGSLLQQANVVVFREGHTAASRISGCADPDVERSDAMRTAEYHSMWGIFVLFWFARIVIMVTVLKCV